MSEADREQTRLAALLYNNLGLQIAGQALPSAIAMLKRAVLLNPLDSNVRLNLASYLASAGEDAQAFTLISRVIEEQPQSFLAWGIMGALATRRGDLEDAIHCYERAHAFAPDDPQVRFNLAAAYLRNGEFELGWPHYEARRRLNGTLQISPPKVPEWQGQRAKHVFVYGEQGVGDKIQFARFLPWVRSLADKVTLATDPGTTTLLWGYSKVCDIVLGAEAAVGCDYQIPIGSLPRLYGLHAGNIPPDPGLLQTADSSDQISVPGLLKIGLVWAGNPLHPNDDIRSLKFEDVLPLCSDPRNAIFSLQVGPRSADIANAQAQRLVTDLSGVFQGDWSHTAAVISQMDLIVCADTGIAHLAGALGKPVFVMVQRFSDWRWMWDRSDTPWYPSMRLFRQEKIHEWKPVVAAVAAAIAALHGKQPRTSRPAPIKQEYEPDVSDVLRRVLRPGDCFFDVGANVGIHTVAAAGLVGPDGEVYALEPGSNNLPALREAVAELPQVEIVDAPAWSISGELLPFHLCADGGGGNALWDPGEFPTNAASRAKPESVLRKTTTLDRVMAAAGADVPRLIKIDTEGAEEHVLRGARTMLELHPPFIVAELHDFGLDKLGCSQLTLRAFMREAGYDTFVLFADGSRPWRVPENEILQPPLIINLLFSLQHHVDAAWPLEATSLNRPMHGYGPTDRSVPNGQALTRLIDDGLASVAPAAIKLSTQEGHHGRSNGLAAE